MNVENVPYLSSFLIEHKTMTNGVQTSGLEIENVFEHVIIFLMKRQPNFNHMASSADHARKQSKGINIYLLENVMVYKC